MARAERGECGKCIGLFGYCGFVITFFICGIINAVLFGGLRKLDQEDDFHGGLPLGDYRLGLVHSILTIILPLFVLGLGFFDKLWTDLLAMVLSSAFAGTGIALFVSLNRFYYSMSKEDRQALFPMVWYLKKRKGQYNSSQNHRDAHLLLLALSILWIMAAVYLAFYVVRRTVARINEAMRNTRDTLGDGEGLEQQFGAEPYASVSLPAYPQPVIGKSGLA